jgi:hypothetical protein
MREIEGPVTREKVRDLALAEADDQSMVAEIIHEGFNSDEQCGGYAFVYGDGLVIYGLDGGNQWSIDPGDESGRLAKVEQYWRRSQHQHRPLGLADVSDWHRAAIAALVSRATSVADLPAEARQGVTEVAKADEILVLLRRYAKDRSEATALRVLAANDSLLALPGAHSGAHPCPVCGSPAIGRPWGNIVGVCDDCHAKAVCSDGRRVHGYNTHISGGFQAVHLDDRSVCEEVTRDGHVWVGDRRCRMGEAKFGGVYVGVEAQRT